MSAAAEQRIGGCVRLRPMLEDDLEEVLAIECAVYGYPWTEGIFRDCLRAGYSCWVGLEQGRIRVYGVMSVATGESHLLNLCVDPASQGQGLGKGMLSHLLGVAVSHAAEVAFLEVRPSNKVAMGLYQQLGFSEVGLRPGYYPASNGREDAMVMALELAARHQDW